MLDSALFLLCISVIICTIIICITVVAYKRHSNNIEDNIEVSEYYPDDFIFLGNYYINIYDIESIYLDNENWRITIDTGKSQYEWDFDDDSEYYQYINHLDTILNIR